MGLLSSIISKINKVATLGNRVQAFNKSVRTQANTIQKSAKRLTKKK